MHVPAFVHVENVARVQLTFEVEEGVEVEFQEQQQEFEVTEQVEDPVPAANLANLTRSKASTGTFNLESFTQV